MKNASFLFYDDGTYLNNDLPLVLLKQSIQSTGSINPATVEKAFRKNNWTNSWRNGLYPFHHYHSTAHETLGLYLSFDSRRYTKL